MTDLTGSFLTATGEGRAWRLLGPGGGGAQFIPAISPHDPGTMLVACDMTGGYLTRDGGQSWAQFNLRSPIHSFCFDPIDPATIYAGSTGLFRSTDAGRSWRLLFPDPTKVTADLMLGDHADHRFESGYNWPGWEIQCIRVDAFDPARLFLGISTGQGLSIFCSEDAGQSFRELCRPAGQRFHALHLACSSSPDGQGLYYFTDREACIVATGSRFLSRKLQLPDGVTALVHAACGDNPGTGMPEFYLLAERSQGAEESRTELWKSYDCGQSWQPLETKPGQGASAALAPLKLSMLAIPEKDCRTVYAGVDGALEYGSDTGSGSAHSWFGVIKSADGGETWRWVLKSDYAEDSPNLQTGWAERDYGLPWYLTGPKGVGPIGLGVSPTNPDVCCTTDLSSSFLTTDGGESWRQVYSVDHPDGSVSSRGLEVTTCYGVHFDPFDRGHIAISYTDIGMFHSRDGGRSWLHGIYDLPVAWGNTCYWIVFDPDVRGRAWSAWGGAHDLPRPKMMRSGSFHRYEGGVCKSEDGMASWQKSNGGMPGNCVVTHLVLDPKSPAGRRTLYAAGFDKGVYKSTDDGATWALMNNGIQGNRNAWQLALVDGTLYLLVARGLRGKEVVDGAMYKSVDGAAHWEPIPLPSGVNAPNDLIFDLTNPKRMYLSCWPVESDHDAHGGGLYVTEDGGGNWRSVFDPSAHVYAAALHPQDPSVLFAVTFDSAAWVSQDRGQTWERIAGYDFKWGHRPVVDPQNGGMLYITTFGSSVWYGPWKWNSPCRSGDIPL